MARKLLCALLSALMVLSCFGTVVFAEEEAELMAWTGTVMAVKGNAFAYETKNYSESYSAWDKDTGYYYMHYDSVVNTSSENLESGTGSKLFYIGRWGMSNPVSESDGKAYVAMLVRTNSASVPAYQPMSITPNTVTVGEAKATTAFSANDKWEFSSIDLEFPSETEMFAHGQLRFGTEDGKYLELAAWGIFPATVAKSDAEATLKNAAVCTDAEVKVTELCDRSGNVIKTVTLLKGSFTLPDYEDTTDSSFAGWTDTKGSYNVIADGGTNYTPTADTKLYPVWVDFVRFVDETAATNGNGLSASTPYNKFADAAADLATSGGTIVIVGTKDATSEEETEEIDQTTFASLNNTGDILITSVYDGVDYRPFGAKLWLTNSYFGYVENPGKVTLDNLNIGANSWGNWHLHGHETVIKDTCTVTDDSGANITNIQLLAVVGAQFQNYLPALHKTDINIYVGNRNNAALILGARQELTIKNADITVDGHVNTIAVSNNTYEKGDWVGIAEKFGQLTIDGNVRITVNGSIKEIGVRKHYLNATEYDYGLKEVTGDIGLIINHGGKMTGTFSDIAKERTSGKWFILNGAEGASLAWGNGTEVILTLNEGADYNFANLSDGKDSYAFFIENGEASITIPKSGNYTMTLSKNESKTVSFVDAVGGNTIDDMRTIAGLSVTLPTLENTDTHTFAGWTSTQNGQTAEYEGGESYTVSDNVTLYAVWSEAETYSVIFMANGEEFHKVTGIPGKKVVYPEAYPEKDGYYFKKWDKTITAVGDADITVNAEFVSIKDAGYVYYWKGDAEKDGNGSYNNPFKLMASVINAASKTGGTVVLTGRCETIYSPRTVNTEEIYFTSLDPITGVDYRGEFKNGEWTGACFYMTTGTYWGGVNGIPGMLRFDNVDIVNVKGAYGINHWTFDGHPVYIGENVKHLSAESGTEIDWFIGGTSSNGAVEPHIVKAVYKRGILGANWLARGGGNYNIDGLDFEFHKKSVLNVTHNSSDAITINGPMKFTFFGESSDSRLYHSDRNNTSKAYIFGAKAYASVILNDGVSIKNELDISAQTGIDGKMFVISSPEGGKIVHTNTKGDYLVSSDTYNFAELLDSEGNVVDSVIVVGNATLTAPSYGNYTVVYSNKDLYRIDYSTAPYDELCPESYAVSSEETDKHTITLPTLAHQNAHKFLGWTTTENGTVAEFAGGTQYTLTGAVRMYAVWDAISTCTVTFKDDNGNVLHTVTGFVGMALTFPEKDPYKYGEKLLGYAYEGTTDILGKDSVIPESSKTAVPVWGAIPAGETRIYVDASKGNDTNNGISPDKAVATIAKAVEILRENGGYIIVCGGANTLEGGWNNKGDITLTSVDPVTGINYKADTLSEDKLTWKDGAYITHKPISLGYQEIAGKITFENITLGSAANYTYINFNGHPYEIGNGINYFRKDADDAQIALEQRLFTRSLGEVDSKKMNPEGLVMTFNTLNKLYVPHILGKAELTIPRVEIHINSEFPGNLNFSNDSGGGKATVKGDVFITANANAKGFVFGQNYTNPIEGNIYAIYNNNSTCNTSSLAQAEGYAKYLITAGNAATLSHGETAGTIDLVLNDGYNFGYVKLADAENKIAGFEKIVDGKASFTFPYAGSFTLEFTDTALYSISFETGDEEISIPTSWYTAGTDVELLTDIYRYGYKFMGWTDGETTYDKGLIEMPENNVVLEAVWATAPEYTVSFDANGSDIVVPEDVKDFHGENIVLKKVSSDKASFIGWNTDKNAKTGVLNHIIEEDTTLYAITSEEPSYIINSYYRGDPNDYTGPRCQFRRYVIDVYLENAVASEGAFKLDTDNGFLYYLGHVPQEGIDAVVTAPTSTGTVAGTPGLQYCTTKTIEFTWTAAKPIDTTGGRIKIASIMMYFSAWGMGYSEIEKRTTDEAVSPLAGYTATVDGKEAFISANFHKGIKQEEVTVSGKVTLEGRESGTGALYDFAKLYILDDTDDAVGYIVLEDSDSDKRTFTYKANVNPGEYTLKVVKNGYVTRNVVVNVSENCTLPDIVLHGGDIADETGLSDGKIDIDDFIRVLRGFSAEFPNDLKHAVDINEDGQITVSDLAIIKSGFGGKRAFTETVTVIGGMKMFDWKVNIDGETLNITAGSDKAAENALGYINEKYISDGYYTGPANLTHYEDYEITNVNIGNVSLGEYRIVIAENDETALEYANYIREYIGDTSGYALPIVYDTEDASEYEILVGATSRADNPVTEIEKYLVYEEDGSFYVFYGDEQSAELGAMALCEDILGKNSESFDGTDVTVTKGIRKEGEWTVLTRFGVMSDTHVGEGKNWANYNWLHNTFTNFENIHKEKPFDFMVSLGDNIDDGYINTYEKDYNTYLELMKDFDLCDAENPVEGRAEGKIPHYEVCGNHDPVGLGIDGAGKIRFMKNGLWYTENENGEKVAHIAFFTDYGGYPLYNNQYSGSTESYRSYGKANDAMVAFVENSIIAANAAGAKHIILYNHYGISQQVGSPVLPETGLEKIARVCEKYDIKLYFNGHEHDNHFTLRRFGDIYDYDASMTANKHAVVEITTLRAKVTIYNSSNNTVYREDIIPLSGRGEAKQTLK